MGKTVFRNKPLNMSTFQFCCCHDRGVFFCQKHPGLATSILPTGGRGIELWWLVGESYALSFTLFTAVLGHYTALDVCSYTSNSAYNAAVQYMQRWVCSHIHPKVEIMLQYCGKCCRTWCIRLICLACHATVFTSEP